MNLLVTNTQYAQAYSIIRALRPYADKIVVTMHGTTWFKARTAHAANSRLVDRRYYVPRPEKDWLAGNIRLENTSNEEAYVCRIEEICRLEQIDTIFPSYDPEVYIFAKNTLRLAQQGVLVVGPDYEVLRTPLDKYASVKAAERVGLPTPRTYLPASVDELHQCADEVGPPWVIKPRFTAGSQGNRIVQRREDLETAFVTTAARHHRPILQEFVPGQQTQHFYLMADRHSDIRTVLCPEIVRITRRLYRNSSAAGIVHTESPYLPQVQALVREIGWWGGLTIQTKIDVRDGRPKLMEMNPRLGSSLWFRTESGVNEPLLWLQLARGEAVGEIPPYPEGAILLKPLEDLIGVPFELLDLLVYSMRTLIGGAAPTDPHNLPLTLVARMKTYVHDYCNQRRKIISPHTRYLFDDPLPCLLWYYGYIGYLLRGLKEHGR